jgi:TonB family protein
MTERSFLPVLLSCMLAGAAPATGAISDDATPPREYQGLVLSAPRPDYPIEARRRYISGSGVADLEVDPATGLVKRVRMAPSTRSSVLDQAAISAFQKWRFKPGKIARVRIPIAFTMQGGTVSYDVERKPVDEVLARYLGAGSVAAARLPIYPSFQPWTFKQGKGVYELHVLADGHVEKVLILKSSGDERFDKITVKGLQKWRFNRGPIIIELPLHFVLTPTSYSVDVAR